MPILIFFGIILLFFIFREFLTWYWKLNEMVDTLKRIEVVLEDIEEKLPIKEAHKEREIQSKE